MDIGRETARVLLYPFHVPVGDLLAVVRVVVAVGLDSRLDFGPSKVRRRNAARIAVHDQAAPHLKACVVIRISELGLLLMLAVGAREPCEGLSLDYLPELLLLLARAILHPLVFEIRCQSVLVCWQILSYQVVSLVLAVNRDR